MTTDTNVPKMTAMFATDLSYVRYQLGRLTPAELGDVADRHDVHPKTLRRILSKETQAPGADTISKLAIFFRSIERRQKRAA